jgi:hypothetical protein
LSASTFANCCHFLNITIEDANVVPQSLWPQALKDFWFAHFSRENTSHLHNNLRRVSKSPLLHPFTCHRSSTLDWCVTRATSADSNRLIHTILAHSSTSFFNLLSP